MPDFASPSVRTFLVYPDVPQPLVEIHGQHAIPKYDAVDA